MGEHGLQSGRGDLEKKWSERPDSLALKLEEKARGKTNLGGGEPSGEKGTGGRKTCGPLKNLSSHLWGDNTVTKGGRGNVAGGNQGKGILERYQNKKGVEQVVKRRLGGNKKKLGDQAKTVLGSDLGVG